VGHQQWCPVFMFNHNEKPTAVSPRRAKAPSGSRLSPSPADLTAPNEPALPSQGTKSVRKPRPSV